MHIHSIKKSLTLEIYIYWTKKLIRIFVYTKEKYNKHQHLYIIFE